MASLFISLLAMSNAEKKSDIVIYKTEDNQIELKVQLEKDTVWLTQEQMSFLFDKARSTINEHINNIFKEEELVKADVMRKFGNSEFSAKPTNYYNLDVVISVGYRVKSQRGTQFRIWATNVLRKYLVQGYAINQKRLEKNREKYLELQTYLNTLRRVIDNEEFSLEESKELVRIITDYTKGLELIQQTDDRSVELPGKLSKESGKQIEYKEAVVEIEKMRETLGASGLFGQEKDGGFKSALSTIFQTFDGKDLYPSLEEKAANLLYLIIKNHPFSDGNKRIGSIMFLIFLDKNKMLYRGNKTKLVEENALVAIALLIAQSDPKDKDLMTKLVVNLLVI